MFVAKNGSFLEKEFISKELSGRKVELDEVIEPSLQLDGMMMIMKLQIKLLLSLVGRQGIIPPLSGMAILSWRSCC